ncbi:hypothetical protein [Merismopedia glauca]|uniref:hypothetical protein n=1 Tax=Merismopedia glauca TaxID=292586 RepID=UPI0011B25FB2
MIIKCIQLKAIAPLLFLSVSDRSETTRSARLMHDRSHRRRIISAMTLPGILSTSLVYLIEVSTNL